MTAKYKFIDHTADIAVKISGNTFSELFIAAMSGWKESIIKASRGERKTEKREISLTDDSPEELLVSFLQELNFLFENKKLIPLELNDLHIEEKDDQFFLKSVMLFSPVSPDDEVKREVKAITFHQLDIKKINDVYETIIVFDI